MLLLSLVVVVPSLGCSERPPPPTAPLVAGTSEQAAARVRSFLDAYKAGDAAVALSHLCDQDAGTRGFLERSLAPGSPFRITGYDVTAVTPLWERSQPLYLVTVRLPRRSGEPLEQGYRVRAGDGCIERLLPALTGRVPTATTPPSPHEDLSLDAPEKAPAGAPVDEGAQGAPDDDDDGRWGPPLPSAPVSDDDEVIDL